MKKNDFVELTPLHVLQTQLRNQPVLLFFWIDNI